jgi:hypothetical protein
MTAAPPNSSDTDSFPPSILALTGCDKVTLVPLPAYSPELNLVEQVWLYLRFLPEKAISEACCRVWNALAAQLARLRSLCAYPWITKILLVLGMVSSGCRVALHGG